MKFVALVAVAFAMSTQPLGAAPRELTFVATVTSSTRAAGLPTACAAIQGRLVFNQDPAAYVAQPCPGLDPSECRIYSYSTPYTFFLDLPYPTVARYNGTGSTNVAANFVPYTPSFPSDVNTSNLGNYLYAPFFPQVGCSAVGTSIVCGAPN